MAIGSAPEIGMTFGTWGKMTAEQQTVWFQHMNTIFGTDLLGGYGQLVYPDPAKRKEYLDAILLSLPEM